MIEPLHPSDCIATIIASAFGQSLPIEGGWGYTQKDALRITSTTTPLRELEHTIALMRTHLEMSMTRPPEQRYGSININALQHQSVEEEGGVYHCVTYRVEAMLESEYQGFIAEYKAEFGKASFDIEAHFTRRKRATLTREVILWFDVSAVE